MSHHIPVCFKYVSGFIIFIFLVYPGIVFSKAVLDGRIMIPSSPNPVGSGARAIGMGGAFIAIADDATAASWNPAGLIQLERPEISCVGAFVFRSEKTSYAAFPESSGKLDIHNENFNYFSLAYPFQFLQRNMTVSLNYQHMFNFDKRASLNFTKDYNIYTSTSSYQLSQDGDLYSLSPAYAIQLTPYLSMGFTLNFWEDGITSNKWRTDYSEKVLVQQSSGSFLSKVAHSDVYTFEGINFHFGFLWNINNIFTLGGIFKSEFEADLNHEHYYNFEQKNIKTNTVSIFDEKMNMPMSFGLGLAMRLSDAFSIGFDLYRTLWEDYYIIASDGRKISPLSGKNLNETSINPTTQVRLGMEYLFIREKMIVPVRGGIFYDPEPSDQNPDDFYGFTIGTGLVYKMVAFDVSYQYRLGRDVRGVEIGGSSSTMDVNEHSIFFSLVLYL